MTNPRQRLGIRGENLAAERLRRAGYEILARNWRHPELGELDIVARRGDEIVFVEVRTRRGPLQAAVEWALASVDARKQARLAQLAEAYLIAHNLVHVAWRIDIIAVAWDGTSLSIEVITDGVDW